MSIRKPARCLRCHAGSEWIEGSIVVVDEQPRPTISEERMREIADLWNVRDGYDRWRGFANQILREAGVTVTAAKDEHE